MGRVPKKNLIQETNHYNITLDSGIYCNLNNTMLWKNKLKPRSLKIKSGFAK